MHKLLALIILLMVPLSSSYANEALPWCDGENPAPSSQFNHIKKINVILDYQNLDKLTVDFPDRLSKASVKEHILKEYTPRFEKIKCDCRRKNCYGRNNQPIDFFPYSTKNDKEKALKASQEKNILTVYIKIKAINNQALSITSVNYRPYATAPLWRKLLRTPEPLLEYAKKPAPNGNPYVTRVIIDLIKDGDKLDTKPRLPLGLPMHVWL